MYFYLLVSPECNVCVSFCVFLYFSLLNSVYFGEMKMHIIGYQICEILPNSERIWTAGRVIQGHWSWGNQKCICDFLLVINSNFGRIFYRFQDIDVPS